MDNSEIQLVGGACGQHGPYTFYKAFKYTKNGIKRILSLSEFFFVKLWIDSDLLCVGELQLLWIDKNSDQILASLRLYFLPENTPDGRMDHGEDEVLAIAEKVVLRVEDLITWITVDVEWTWGKLGLCDTHSSKQEEEENDGGTKDDELILVPSKESSIDFSDVEKEKKKLESNGNEDGTKILILSYAHYCRYRAVTRRISDIENEALRRKIAKSLSGFKTMPAKTRIMFCRDTFDYPELEGHEMLCNHLAPKLKGRPRGRRKKRSVSPGGSESNESESSVSNHGSKAEDSTSSCSRSDTSTNLRRSTRSTENNESKEFIKTLTAFMKSNRTPLGRIPCLGYKELDLYDFYSKVQKLGGYDAVTTNRLWKSIFDEMSGHQNSTSAATIIRRHYERFLLAYERNTKGEQDKPLPISERRRLKSKAGSSKSSSSAVASTSRACSSPVAHCSKTLPPPMAPSTSSERKEHHRAHDKLEAKTSSLRSVRVKPERKEKSAKVTKTEEILDKTENNNIKQEIKEEATESPPPIKEEIKEEPEEPKNDVQIKLDLSLIEKTVEPVTSAVAPVVQKVSPDKTTSPVEGKENILPIVETGDLVNSTTSKICEADEVPYKPKSPEKVKVDVNSFKSANSNTSVPFIHEFKKRKLDILKEGGLEVTPVRSFSIPSATKEVRPSVIQKSQLSSKTIKSDVQHMPPPPLVVHTTPPKRLPINIPQALNISKIAIPCSITQSNKTSSKQNNKLPSTFSYGVGPDAVAPPKVLQSKSIYSYSEKTVYGNPKDDFCNPINPLVHTPRFVNSNRHSGGDILDLTLSSPQKPAVEIMRIPNIPMSTSTLTNYRNTAPKNHKSNSISLLDGRKLGSNLEITLVGPNSKPPPSSGQNNNPYYISQYFPNYSTTSHSQKRPSNDHHHNNSVSKQAKIEENGKYRNNPLTPSMIQEVDITIPKLPRTNKPESSTSSNSRHFPQSTPTSAKQPSNLNSPYSAYYSQLFEGSKGLSPYYPQPTIDPLLYNAAMQNFYSNSLGAPSPMMNLTLQDQLKLYSDLIQSGRVQFPFQIPQDGNHSVINNKKH